MAKSANINIRMDPVIKADVEQLFSRFGITVTDAINIFLHQSLMVGGIPFEVRQPRYNAETEAVLNEAKGIANGKVKARRYTSAKELFDELNNE